MADKAELINQIRYAERLCLRTARLYRRIATASAFATVVGGGAAMSALSSRFPDWLSIGGAVVFGLFGAAILAVRPTDKAVANEQDARRYAQLRSAAGGMEAAALLMALDKARETDCPEIEALRDVAFNDVVVEIGRADLVVPLGATQRMVASLA